MYVCTCVQFFPFRCTPAITPTNCDQGRIHLRTLSEAAPISMLHFDSFKVTMCWRRALGCKVYKSTFCLYDLYIFLIYSFACLLLFWHLTAFHHAYLYTQTRTHIGMSNYKQF